MDIDRGVLALLATKLGLHALSVSVFTYGYAGDETYYLACADHLSWGYVDHPPLSIWLLWAVRGVLGDSLPALRLVPALAGGLTVLVVATMARDLGGGRLAQRLAALATLTAPAYLSIGGFWSMNSLDLLLWSVALLLVVRLVQGGGQRVWLALGGTLALALLDKLSALWLGGALWVGILATPHRTWLATRGPWLASAIAAVGLVPYGVWQVANGWPTLTFVHEGSVDKLLHVGPLQFLGSQLLILGPLNAPLWFGGLLTLLAWRPYRILALVWLLVCGLLIVHGNVRAYYLAAAYPPLFAAGAVLVERLSEQRRWVGWTVATAIALTGVVTAPLALPLLPVDRYLAYAAAIGLSAPVEQADARTTPLPLHFAAQLSGPPVARGVAEAWRGLVGRRPVGGHAPRPVLHRGERHRLLRPGARPPPVDQLPQRLLDLGARPAR